MEDRTVFQLFTGEDVRYRVPIYQRHYVWDDMHWQHIWDDIVEKTDLMLEITGIDQPIPHFTGVIVTRKNEKNGEVEIVDGQQRLTTFQIILCSIRDVCTDICKDKKVPDSKRILEFVSRLLKNSESPTHDTTPDNIYKLLPTDGPDRKAFRNLVAGSIDDSSGLLLKAYNNFKKKIKSYVDNDYDKMATLFQTLIYYFKIVQMTLDPDQPAARIFESLNGRGLPLTQFDLLRNNLFLRASDERNNLYEGHWQHFNTASIWFSDEIVDDFLGNFLQAKLNDKYNPTRSLFDLYQRVYIKNLRQKLDIDMGHEDNPKLVEQEFKELQGYSKVYAEITNCGEDSPLWFYQFLKTDLLKNTSWPPLILFLKSELELSEENEKRIFRILESYIVRQFLCYPEIPEWIREHEYRRLRTTIVRRIRHVNEVGEVNKVIVEDILDILKKQKEDLHWPDDEKVKEALKNMGNHWSTPLQKYILFKIERQITHTILTVNPLTWSKKLTREHIMPRGWEKATDTSSELSWPVAPGGDCDKKVLMRNQHVESIGNLTLLTDKANELVATAPFSKKKELFNEYSHLSITNDVVSKDNWDVEQIQERVENLCEIFYQIWRSADKC